MLIAVGFPALALVALAATGPRAAASPRRSVRRRLTLVANGPFTLASVDRECFYAPGGAAKGWPWADSRRTAPIRGSFNEVRALNGSHFGVDVAASADAADVYAIDGGTLIDRTKHTMEIADTPTHRWIYWHLQSTTGWKRGMHVFPHELLGQILQNYYHVHISEKVKGCRYVDPRRPTGNFWNPANTQKPIVGSLSAYVAGGAAWSRPPAIDAAPPSDPATPEPLDDLHGIVDLRALAMVPGPETPINVVGGQTHIPDLAVSAIRAWLTTPNRPNSHLELRLIMDGAGLVSNPQLWHKWAWGTWRDNGCSYGHPLAARRWCGTSAAGKASTPTPIRTAGTCTASRRSRSTTLPRHAAPRSRSRTRWLIPNPRDVLGGENRASQGRRERSYRISVWARPRTMRGDGSQPEPTTPRVVTTDGRPGARGIGIDHLDCGIAASPNTLVVTGHGLAPADVADVALRGRSVEVAAAARERMQGARGALERALREGRQVYGLTTGLGPRVVEPIAPEQAGAQAARIVRGRATAVGEPLPSADVRATLLARLNGLCAGGAGASPAVAETLAAMLNAGVHPIVPRTGSIGAGDLCLLAHVGLVVLGEGEAEVGGERMAGGEALRSAGIDVPAIGPGDGLALCNASSVAAGIAALVVDAGDRLLDAVQIAAALSMEGFRASTSPIDAHVAGAHAAPGQEWEAAGLRELLRGGSLLEARTSRRLQDPLSFRCASHVHGALRWTLDLLAVAVHAALNGAGDNPLVLAGGEIVSTGNFHTPALAVALDATAIAIAQTAGPAAERPARLATDRLSGLAANLTRAGDGRSGVAPLLKTAQALAVEIRHLAAPLAIDPRFGADGVEDDSTNAAAAALRVEAQLGLLGRLIGLELVCAAQAVDLAAPTRLGRGTATAHACVRELVAALDDDRPLGADVERVARELVASGVLRERVREAVRWPDSS